MELYYGIILLAITASIYLLLQKITVSKKLNLPPGPWNLPLIGSIHHLTGSHLPHHLFRRLSKQHGPFMHLKLGQVSMIIVSSPEYAKEIMKTHDIDFATRPLFPIIDILTYNGKGLAFGPYGDYWRQLKRISVIELLSVKRVQSYSTIREEEMNKLVHSIVCSRNEVVNLSKKVVQMTSNLSMRVVMGKTCDDQNTLIEGLHEAEELGATVDLADLFPSFAWILNLFSQSKYSSHNCHMKMDRILESIVEEHRGGMKNICGGKEENFVDVLLRLQAENDVQIDNDGIKALLSDMFSGGYETTASTIQWAMAELMRNPSIMKKAQQEVREACEGKERLSEMEIKNLKYLQLVIKETLRLHPPLPLLLPRECQKECKVGEYEIPAKSRVVVNGWAILRDPNHWENAEEFVPERFEGSKLEFKGSDFEYLPFGAGRRMCPGMTFGLATIEFTLASLLFNFDWELPSDLDMKTKSLDMSESFGLATRKKFDLLVSAKVQRQTPSQSL